jgi:mono/diheme cytochrome c family protein
MNILRGIFVLLIIEVLVILGFIYSGMYDVSALRSEPAPVYWILQKTRERSVLYHSSGIQAPAGVSSLKPTEGLGHYQEMCKGCHGAPGVEPSEIAMGLNPGPPDLKEAAGELQPSVLFWIVKNGIKMTGMPAFAPTHNDESIWKIVAFLQHLPKISEEEYGAMVKKMGKMNKHNHH